MYSMTDDELCQVLDKAVSKETKKYKRKKQKRPDPKLWEKLNAKRIDNIINKL